MIRASVVIAFLFPGLLATSALGQWVEFADETGSRIDSGQDPNSGPNVITTNNDEKDYAWGDVDNDGDVDLVAVYKQLGTSTGKRRNVLLLNENGILVDRTTQYATASNVTLPAEVGGGTSQGFLDLTNDRDVVVVDVNGDGWLDIVTAPTLSGIPAGTNGGKALSHPRVYINLKDDPPGSGNWQGFSFDDEDRIPTQPTEPRFAAVAAGDVDGDLDPDLYFGDHEQGGSRVGDLDNRLFINDGNGYFSDESEARMTYEQREVSFCMSVALADMNSDGTVDAVRDDALSSPTAVSIAYNDPNNEGFFGTFNGGNLDHVYTQSPYHISVGDLNNDLLLDIVISDDGTDRYILNRGNGADGLVIFGPPRLLVGSASNQFGGNNFIADLNKDGFNDVLVANVDPDVPSCSQPSKFFRNLGLLAGGFNVTLEEQGTGGISASDLNGVHDFAVFDIDGDTWLDLVIGRCNGTSVYMNQPPVIPCNCPADVSDDGLIDGGDVQSFVACFTGSGSNCGCADLDPGPGLDENDVAAFVSEMLSGGTCP